MSQEAREHVGKGLDLLKEGLTPFVEARLESKLTSHWKFKVSDRIPSIENLAEDGEIFWDAYFLLKTMMIFWKEAFNDLKNPARSYVGEVFAVRNNWAHQQNFTHDDADRAIDTMRRLLEIVGKKETVMKEVIEELNRLQEKMKPAVPGEDDSASPVHWKSYDLQVR